MKSKLKFEDGKVNFKCLGKHCKKSCCNLNGFVKGAIPFFTPDFDEIYLTENDVKKLKRNALSYVMEKHANGEDVMKLRDDLSCIALVDGKCEINEFKPTMCKAFPFYIDMFGGLAFAGGDCEGIDHDMTPVSELKGDIDACIEMYQYWIGQISVFKDGL